MLSGNLFVRSGVRCLAAAVAFSAFSLTAHAQDESAPPAWVKVCSKNQAGEEGCIVSQELRAETGRPIAFVSIQSAPEPGKYGLGIVVPIGVLLPPGLTLTVDGAKLTTAPYVICLPPGNQQPPHCLAQTVVSEDFIASLKKGNKLGLVAVNAQNKQMALEMTLIGFSKAFDGPGVDPASAAAAREQLSEAVQKKAEEARQKLIEQQQKEIGNAPQ